MDYNKIIQATPPKPKFALPSIANLLPKPPRTVATLKAEVDRDGYGHEELHARLRDHTGGMQPGPANVAWDVEVDIPKKKKREPLYKRLGDGLPPPKSEREYAPHHFMIVHLTIRL